MFYIPLEYGLVFLMVIYVESNSFKTNSFPSVSTENILYLLLDKYRLVLTVLFFSLNKVITPTWNFGYK